MTCPNPPPRGVGNVSDRARASVPRGLLVVLSQHAPVAAMMILRRMFGRGRPPAGELGMRPLVAHCHLGLGKLYRRTDKGEQARDHLATATTMCREMGMTYWLEKAEDQRD
jgi:hypothetical protein